MVVLLTVKQLHDVIETQETVVIDVRFTLGIPNQGFQDYIQAHIPGAYYFDLEKDLSGPVGVHGGRHPLPNEEQLAMKLGAAGIGPGNRVVVYDAGGGMAARAWWLIRYLGHNDVYLLDGGFKAWSAAGYETTSEVPLPKHIDFPLNVHRDWIVSTESVEDMVDGSEAGVLLDARAVERYRGDMEPLDPKAGHIPGALSLPFQQCFAADGHWKTSGEIKAYFKHALAHEKPLVAYCGSGVTACNLLVASELAGIEGMRLYPGSWSDWSSYSNHRIETGSTSDFESFSPDES